MFLNCDGVHGSAVEDTETGNTVFNNVRISRAFVVHTIGSSYTTKLFQTRFYVISGGLLNHRTAIGNPDFLQSKVIYNLNKFMSYSN